MDPDEEKEAAGNKESGGERPLILFLCGDVMTGRGIDQILPHPSDPILHEPYMKSAEGYVRLAEEVNGPIPRPADFAYIWGDALNEFQRQEVDLRIINLETAVTKSDRYWRGKGIHYRMHPENVPCLSAARIDFCALANNHILDWGYTGLTETLETLEQASLKFAGAGRNRKEAEAPAVFEVEGKGRAILFSFGSETSGIPFTWAATEKRPGVNLLEDFSDETVRSIGGMTRKVKRPGDVVVASIHWGGNWGYRISPEEKKFAHALIDQAGVDLIHGHSSHHVKGVEVYRDRLILYGCGDFLNDYQGIGGYEDFRGDLSLMYFASVLPSTGKLGSLKMIPARMRRLQVRRALREDALELREVLNREGRALGTRARLNENGTLTLEWSR